MPDQCRGQTRAYCTTLCRGEQKHKHGETTPQSWCRANHTKQRREHSHKPQRQENSPGHTQIPYYDKVVTYAKEIKPNMDRKTTLQQISTITILE